MTETFYIIAPRRMPGLMPKLSKAVDDRMYFDIRDAEERLNGMPAEYGMRIYEVHAEVVEEVEP